MGEDGAEVLKSALRKQALARRAGLDPDFRLDAAQSASFHFFDKIAFGPEDAVAGYWAIRDEIDCQPILVRLLECGQTVILPVVTDAGAPLEMRVWAPDAPLYEAGFGTLAPSELAPRRDPDLILVPLVGYDSAGTRLGYGGGYYDRTLAHLPRRPLLVGLAYSAQRLDHIPREAHDMPLDAVVTEEGVQFFGERS
ncbi:5-formyltetrahydrofolate cyclo-ligase [Devosia crocina]|uniref:5-formyltetrahydrofolate cyclo-ligase n=1 Tax=Devosia crocina TaxID=429728 RepID=A0A1I7MX91_9HYPH|nr:5-formyltetrahydrofolate cyclo-ligase [Devosia crocina]SFV27037.1 5-formyltetrahydrofolate cyclo-ligase [Devosia crocina]